MKTAEGIESNKIPEVLVFIPWFQPAYKAGGPIQSVANLVLSDTNTVYRILCSDRDLDGSVLNVQSNCWISLNAASKVWYSSKGIARNLLRQAKGETLYINGIYSWHYNLKPILFSGAARIIVSVRGMLHPGALSQKSLKKKVYLALWKIFGLHKRVEFHATTPEEKGYIQAVFGNSVNVHVASNLPKRLPKLPVVAKRAGTLRLVSIALISPMKNIQIVLEALRNVTAEIQYDIYGPVKDKTYWEQCLHTMSSLPPNIQVTYHGDLLPSAVEKALKTSDVFILPSKSENFGHAIYEALTAGKPVITSHNTPWNDLHKAKAGCNVSLSSGTEEMTKAIKNFAAMEQAEFEEWANGARAYTDGAINLDEIKEQYEKMFAGCEEKIN